MVAQARRGSESDKWLNSEYMLRRANRICFWTEREKEWWEKKKNQIRLQYYWPDQLRGLSCHHLSRRCQQAKVGLWERSAVWFWICLVWDVYQSSKWMRSGRQLGIKVLNEERALGCIYKFGIWMVFKVMRLHTPICKYTDREEKTKNWALESPIERVWKTGGISKGARGLAIEVEGKTESRNSSEESMVKRRECVMLSSGSEV